jgi:serine/threonine protein kinase
LISEIPQAKLADFVLTTIASDLLQDHSLNSFGSGTIRWMSPELFVPSEFSLDKYIPSKESDVYALGMLIYEVISLCRAFGCSDVVISS